jgi:hypothetical protein
MYISENERSDYEIRDELACRRQEMRRWEMRSERKRGKWRATGAIS